MRTRNDKGWLQINDMPVRHYWYLPTSQGVYKALCGRLAAPLKIDTAARVPECPICRDIRHVEEGKQQRVDWTGGSHA